MMKKDGPLPFEYRHYLAIMVRPHLGSKTERLAVKRIGIVKVEALACVACVLISGINGTFCNRNLLVLFPDCSGSEFLLLLSIFLSFVSPFFGGGG